jgi:signal transduction histidine kinase/DNA-binding response OmpR family regulator
VSTELCLLIVEDSEMDTALLLRELRKGGYVPTHIRVDTPSKMREALETQQWDIIISDFIMPQFSGLEALKILQEMDLDIPFIVLSGQIGENTAVETMKAGAQDYIIKGNLKRLIPAIQRELVEADNRRQRKRAEENLKKVNRAREVLIKVNESIMRSMSESELLQTVCRIIVEYGGYRMCWVGYTGQDEHKKVVPVVQAGYEDGYLEKVSITWADTEIGRGPTGNAIRNGKPVVARNIQTDLTYLPWREEAVKRGYASSIALPLANKELIFGVLNIYAAESDRFDTDELQLLSWLASDLSFGILALRTRIECDRVELELRAMANRLVQLQEEERRNIARELHDQIGQSLTALKLMMSQAVRSSAETRDSILNDSQAVITELIQQVREMSLKLRPSMLDDLGLLPTLLWYIERYTRQTQIKVNFEHSGLQRRFTPETNTAVYRIVQEALTNVARYAKVNEVEVRIWADDSIMSLEVKDRGCGFDVSKLTAKASTGISGMRERAQMLGGNLMINSSTGAGTCLTAEVPILKESSRIS